MADVIHIANLEVESRIGVPDEERARPQRLTVSVTLEPSVSFASLGDRIENTIDYALVCEAIQRVAAARPRRLVETLAEEIAAQLLGEFPIWRLTVEVRKYILPQTEFVAVRIDRPL